MRTTQKGWGKASGRKTMLLLGMSAMALAFTVMVAGCGDSDSGGKNTFTLSIAVADGSSGMGTVTITSGNPTGNAAGVSATITATPATDYHFVRWSDNVAGMGSLSTESTYTFTINGNTSRYAVFAPDDGSDGIFSFNGTWTIQFDGGTFTVNCSDTTWTVTAGGGSYTDGGRYTFTGNYGEISSTRFSTNIGMFALTSATEVTIRLR